MDRLFRSVIFVYHLFSWPEGAGPLDPSAHISAWVSFSVHGDEVDFSRAYLRRDAHASLREMVVIRGSGSLVFRHPFLDMRFRNDSPKLIV